MGIKVNYEGTYPCSCSGHLAVEVDGVWYKFIAGLVSREVIKVGENGYWQVRNWPLDFPEKYKGAVEDVINDRVEPGCCGGCR